MDNYYTKYLKYKNKYLELKRTNGGVIGGGVIGSGGVGSGGTGSGGVGSGGVGSGGIGGGVIGSGGVVIRGGNLGTKPCPATFGLFDFTLLSV